MNVKLKELRFLIYFIPLFFLKLLNITAENKLLMASSILCFFVLIICFFRQKIEIKKFQVLMILAIYTAMLVITCGKQGAFFSVVMVLALYDMEDTRRVLRISFWIGLIGVAVSCYIERNGSEQIRYIGGEWTTIFKRSNILYISYTAVLCIRLLLHKTEKVRIIEIFVMAALGYGMYKYTGSRTGFLAMLVLMILLYLFRFNIVQQNKLFKYACIGSPFIGLFFSYITAWLYGREDIIYVIDNMMQGRLRQGKLFLNKYNLKLFGQKIYESSDAANFWNLDCAYLDMLICYGIIFTVIWIVFSSIVIKYLYDRGRYIEVSIVVMYAIYGISETFLPNCFLNVSIFLYAECLYYFLDKRFKRKESLIYENKVIGNVPSSIS